MFHSMVGDLLQLGDGFVRLVHVPHQLGMLYDCPRHLPLHGLQAGGASSFKVTRGSADLGMLQPTEAGFLLGTV